MERTGFPTPLYSMNVSRQAAISLLSRSRTATATLDASPRYRPAMKNALTLQVMRSDKVLNEEAVRIAQLIQDRVQASGNLQTRMAPSRNAPTDLILLVAERL